MSLMDAVNRLRVLKRADGYWRLRYLRGNVGTFKPVYRWIWPLTILLLAACTPYQTRPGWAAPVKVPSELANEVPVPVLADKPDNGDLATWADELRAALNEANRRLRAIRDL